MGTSKIILLFPLALTFLTTVCLSQGGFEVVLPSIEDSVRDPIILNSDAEYRIVGGTEANKNEFPGIVNLVIARVGGAIICGGNILSANWILTAAHCVSPSAEIRGVTVTGGDHNRNEIEPTEQTRTAIKSFVPPSYNATNANDIALVEVSRPFTFNEFVQPVILANPNYVLSGQGIVAGWGSMNSTGASTHELRKATVTFVSNAICAENHAVEITSSMVCASGSNRGTCNGDSGGPILVSSGSGRLLAGITSFGDVRGCGDDRFPDVFQRVSSHLDWIRSFVPNVEVDPGISVSTTTKKPGGDNGVESMSTNFSLKLAISMVVLFRNVIV